MVYIKSRTTKVFSFIYPAYLTVTSMLPFSINKPDITSRRQVYNDINLDIKLIEPAGYQDPEEVLQAIKMEEITEEKAEEENLQYIGTFDMSHYTNETGAGVPKQEGGKNDRKGNSLVAYDSIAIPRHLFSYLPYGSRVKIVTPDNKVYYGSAVDTGSALNRLNRIDRCVSTYREAEALGVVRNVKIYKIG